MSWWPGDPRYPRAAFYGYAHPAPPGYPGARLEPPAARWEAGLGEFVLDWDDVCRADDPPGTALAFVRSVVRHSCRVCDWDPALGATVDGVPPPLRWAWCSGGPGPGPCRRAGLATRRAAGKLLRRGPFPDGVLRDRLRSP